MLRYVIQMEFRSLLRDRWALGLMLLLAGLVAMAISQGAKWQSVQQKQVKSYQDMDDTRFNTMLTQMESLDNSRGVSWRERTDPQITHQVAQQGRLMTLPILDMALLAIGHSDLLPQLVHISVGQSESSLWNRLEIENPLHARTGRFDLAFVMVFLLPLFLLALTFHLLPGDREQGIVALSVVQSAKLAPVLMTRLAVRGGLALAVVVVVVLASLTFNNISWLRSESLWRIMMWLGLVASYTVFWLALSFVANVYARTAASSALMLATAWLVLVVLFPALFNAVLMKVCAPPSRVQLVSAMRTATREATADASKTLAKYYQDHPELRPPGTPDQESEFISRYFATRERSERDVAPILKQFTEQVERQQKLVAQWQYLLPPVMLDQAFSDLAGTGAARHGQFRTQVRKGLSAWQSWFVPKIVQSVRLTGADKDTIPKPAYVDEAKPEVMGRMWPAYGLLIGATIILGAWGTMRLNRYPV